MIPQRKTDSGATTPANDLGICGSDCVSLAQVAEAVKGAAAVGNRNFDCASVHGHEDAVGAEDVIASCRRSLAARSRPRSGHVGATNMTIPLDRLVLRDTRIKPEVNAMELHPH